MKTFIIIILVLMGLYWLFGHTAPFPLNHEQLGLYNHDLHRITGIFFLTAAALLIWKWKNK